MTRPAPMGSSARGEAPGAPRDLSRAHSTTAEDVAVTDAYLGRSISIGSSEGSSGVGQVVLTDKALLEDGAVGLAFRYRDGRSGSRRLPGSTTVLIHRTTSR